MKTVYINNPLSRLKKILFNILTNEGAFDNKIEALQSLSIGDGNASINIGTINQFQAVLNIDIRQGVVEGLKILDFLMDQGPELNDMAVSIEKDLGVVHNDIYDQCLIEIEALGGFDNFKRKIYKEAVKKTNGNKTKAAELIGVSQRCIRMNVRKS